MPSSRLSTEDISSRDAELLRTALAETSTITIGDVSVEVAEHARAVFAQLLSELAAGHQVDVEPVVEFLTTQEAADLLHVSRPTLVKMLNEGRIPYEQPGVHRRVSRAAVEEFLAARRERRERAMAEFAQTHDQQGPDQIVATR